MFRQEVKVEPGNGEANQIEWYPGSSSPPGRTLNCW